MNSLEMYQFVISKEDLKNISLMLANNQLLILPFISDRVDIYNPITYIQEYIIYENQTILLADRNLVTRWIALTENKVKKKDIKLDFQYRLVAAIIAFAQCSNITIEPNIALYEFAMAAGNEEANKELKLFRIADNIHPQYWADFALGRSDIFVPKLPKLSNIDLNQKVNFMMPLRSWRRNYILVLKIAELELTDSNPDHNIIEFIEWMYKEFLFGANALMLANYYLARGNPRKKLLKNLRSTDRKKALNGIKNATWDLTLLTEWYNSIKSQQRTQKISLLCSLDKKLLELASLITDMSESNSNISEVYCEHFKKFWKEVTANKISTIYEKYMTNLSHSSRKLNEYNYKSKTEKFIHDGESFILNWRK